jgi:[acyl-carrier-protein] S-malonyltransferase
MSVRKFFDDAEKLLEIKLAKVCFLGPKEDQDKVFNAQVATFVCDCAFYDPLFQKKRKPELVTGIGVGEIAALVCGESIPYLNALRFVAKRARLLLFVSGIPRGALEPLLRRPEGDLIVTHVLAPDAVIVWGPEQAVAFLQKSVTGPKEVRTNPQNPRGPLFTPLASELEAPLGALLDECLEGLPLKSPKTAFHRVSDGEYVGTPEGVRDVLTKQLSSPVDWVRTVTVLNQRGYRIWAEIGPGKLYGPMARRIDKNNLVTNVEDMNSLNSMVKVTG